MYERLRRIHISLREEERACQVLAAVGVHALCRSFDMSVEKKQGISNLELLYQEISRAEKAKEHKREQKKLKKKKKKSEKKNSYRSCTDVDPGAGSDTAEADEDLADEALDVTRDDDYEEEEELLAITESSVQSNSDNDDIEIMEAEENIISEPSIPLPPLQSKKKLQPSKQKQKLPQKKNKKKKHQQKVAEKKSCSAKLVVDFDLPPTTAAGDELTRGKCIDCHETTSNCPCESDICTKSLDAGYGTDPNSHLNSRTSSVVSTPEGSEVSCSDGFCNHDHDHVAGGHDSENDVEHHRSENQEREQQSDSDDCSSVLTCQPQTNATFSLLQMLVSKKNSIYFQL